MDLSQEGIKRGYRLKGIRARVSRSSLLTS